MMTVGYDMYLKLLEDAVLEERGEAAQKEPECTADLTVTANINKDYVASGEQRMDLYRRMAAIRTQEDADELLDEIVDRFGDPPKGRHEPHRHRASARKSRSGGHHGDHAERRCGSPVAFHDGLCRHLACCAEAQFKGPHFLLGRQGADAVRQAQKAEDR